MKVALTDARGTRGEAAPDPECGPGDVRHARVALTLLRAGAVPAADSITARFSLALAGDALAAHRSGAALKPVVLPWA